MAQVRGRGGGGGKGARGRKHYGDLEVMNFCISVCSTNLAPVRWS